MATNAIQTNDRISTYIQKPENYQEFVRVLGKDAAPYVQSVIIAASSTDDLMQCTPRSVYRAALRAASLGLSCDPALKQAWLVPYNRNIAPRGQQPEWIKEAQFQPHYMGLYFLAMRTNKYRIINVAPIYEGQQVFENPLTGLHAVEEENGFLGQPQSYNSAYSRNVTVRRSQDKNVIGWLGYYKTHNMMEKSVYMSCIEIEEHAAAYVKDYFDDQGKIKNPNWKDPKKRPTMEMKTVLRALLNWADKSGVEHTQQLREALQADEPEAIDGEAKDITPDPLDDVTPLVIEAGKRTTEQNLKDLGFDTESASQETGEPAEVIELIPPHGDWAVNFAAKEWNKNKSETAKELWKKIKSDKPMDKRDFIQIVKPQPQPA